LDEELFEEAMAIKAELDWQVALRKAQLEESNSKLEPETVTSVLDRVNLNPHIRDDKNVRIMM
jgi:hypothetical protein